MMALSFSKISIIYVCDDELMIKVLNEKIDNWEVLADCDSNLNPY